MSTYYLDTSAISKRYVRESGTRWLRALTDPAAGHSLLTARITMVEMYSALARRKREGTVPAAECDTAAHAFTAHSNTDYEFIELDLDVVIAAHQLLERHPLRAYDAVQLASALLPNQALQRGNLASLIFVSADERLNAAAAIERLTIDNPNAHP